MRFPVHLEAEPEGGFTVTFRDVPEAITYGSDQDEALANASDALLTALTFYSDDCQDWPAPSPARDGEEFVKVNTIGTMKLRLRRLLAEHDVSIRELGRRMGYSSDTAAQRLIRLNHATKVAELEKALELFDQHVELQFLQAA